MLIHSASQLITLAGAPQRGRDLGRLGIISNGAVLIRDGLILETGPTLDMLNKYPDEERLDAENKAVLPGFVDPHTTWCGPATVPQSSRCACRARPTWRLWQPAGALPPL